MDIIIPIIIIIQLIVSIKLYRESKDLLDNLVSLEKESYLKSRKINKLLWHNETMTEENNKLRKELKKKEEK